MLKTKLFKTCLYPEIDNTNFVPNFSLRVLDKSFTPEDPNWFERKFNCKLVSWGSFERESDKSLSPVTPIWLDPKSKCKLLSWESL